jgi:hypothetical protein
MLEPGVVRLLLVTLGYSVVQVACIWFFGSDAWEREHVLRVVNSARVRKLLRKPHA